MSATILWSGFTELREALRNLPADLAEESRPIARTAAEGFYNELRGVYPVGDTGNLVRGLRISERTKGKYAHAIVVRSTAPHASIFEHGTKPRQARRRNGQVMRRPANRGIMPAADIFIPRAITYRDRMWPRLKFLVQTAGFEVIGG